MKFLLVPILTALTVSSNPGIPKDDVVFRAMNDEMQRSMQRLHLDQYKGPYFIAYRIDQSDEFTVVASFGAIDNTRRAAKRDLSVDVREGDYSLDSSAAGCPWAD